MNRYGDKSGSPFHGRRQDGEQIPDNQRVSDQLRRLENRRASEVPIETISTLTSKNVQGALEEIFGLTGGSAATNLAYTAAPADGTVTSDTGDDATIPLANGTNAGLMAPAQHTKLGLITATGAVNLDTLASLSHAAASLAGTTSTNPLTLSGQTLGVNIAQLAAISAPPVATDEVMLSRGGALFRSPLTDLLGGGGGGGGGDRTIKLTGSNLDLSTATTTGWTISGASMVTSNGPLGPYIGTHFLDCGSNATSSATQELDVSDYDTEIDAGGVHFRLMCKIADTDDPEDIFLSFTPLDGPSGTALAGQVTKQNRQNAIADRWYALEVQDELPSGTRTVEIELSSRRRTGTANNVAFTDVKPYLIITAGA